MLWPTPQDYNEAIQSPLCLQDRELRSGTVSVNQLGLPIPLSGAFACVYNVRTEKNWAVRCFLHNISKQKERYDIISRFIVTDSLPYTVHFEYLEKGILVRGLWYPLLKMEWVDGLTLDEFIRERIHDQEALQELLANFQIMMKRLREDGIAHGDLQHGNILVLKDRQLRLVDYDGMYVPALLGWHSTELGHRNYQHPERDETCFGPGLDDFSAWVIYLSIYCLTQDPKLWWHLHGGDDCLLFRQADFLHPLQSHVFAILENHAEWSVRAAAKLIRSMLAYSPDSVPAFCTDSDMMRTLLNNADQSLEPLPLQIAEVDENQGPTPLLHSTLIKTDQLNTEPQSDTNISLRGSAGSITRSHSELVPSRTRAIADRIFQPLLLWWNARNRKPSFDAVPTGIANIVPERTPKTFSEKRPVSNPLIAETLSEAIDYINGHDYSTAESYFRKAASSIALKTSAPTGADETVRTAALIGLGASLLEQNKSEEARSIIVDRLKFARIADINRSCNSELSAWTATADMVRKLGALFRQEGELVAATACCDSASYIYKSNGCEVGLAYCEEIMDNLDRAANHWRQALTCIDKKELADGRHRSFFDYHLRSRQDIRELWKTAALRLQLKSNLRTLSYGEEPSYLNADTSWDLELLTTLNALAAAGSLDQDFWLDIAHFIRREYRYYCDSAADFLKPLLEFMHERPEATGAASIIRNHIISRFRFCPVLSGRMRNV